MKTSKARASTADEIFDRILDRADEIDAEHRRANPPPPALPPNFSVDLNEHIRMLVHFEHVTRARESA